jgi:hypothetical protein
MWAVDNSAVDNFFLHRLVRGISLAVKQMLNNKYPLKQWLLIISETSLFTKRRLRLRWKFFRSLRDFQRKKGTDLQIRSGAPRGQSAQTSVRLTERDNTKHILSASRRMRTEKTRKQEYGLILPWLVVT